MLTVSAGNLPRTGRWLLLVMLALLHGAMLLGVNSPWAAPLLLAHVGLFLLWQPLWHGKREVGYGALAFIVLAAAVAVFWLSWWVIAFWLIGLFGLVGARVFVFRNHWSRLLHLSVMVYLLAALLLWVVPHLLGVQPAIATGHFEVGYFMMWYLLPVLLLAMAAMPVRSEPIESAQTLDFIYSLLLFLLLTLVVLGSIAFMLLAQLDYLDALLRTLLLIGLVLLAFGMLWNTRFGFGGLQVMFSRYLLNIGTPFEGWLAKLAETAQREPDAAAYLRHAIGLLTDFPWLSGMSWQSPDGDGQIGQSGKYEVRMQEDELSLTLYTARTLNPTVLLHIHLLAHLIGHFYQAKRREQSLRDMTRLQAVYETGARLTHDMKNMLQSLLSLTAIAQSSEEKAQQLLQQQLPILSRRIELTMSKLEQPHVDKDTLLLSLAEWLDALRLRNRHQQIDWLIPDKLADQKIPAALFDCVVDNLLDNALKERQTGHGISISVGIGVNPLHVFVCDSGAAIPEVIAINLLRRVIISESGLGVGLYQSARWAEQLGYRLTLSSNQDGKVCFELRCTMAASAAKSKK